ncbi:MAG: hypothetical protein ABIO29_03485 [Sphingomicrobium sp.]
MIHKVKLSLSMNGDDLEVAVDSPLWRTSQRYKAGGKFVFSKKENMMGRSDRHVVQFVIHKDNTGLGLQFPTEKNNAIWVIPAETINDCPQSAEGCDYSTIRPKSVETDSHGLRDTLVVENDNFEIANWAFSLNFVARGADESGNGKLVRWDPITQNQNGGSN